MTPNRSPPVVTQSKSDDTSAGLPFELNAQRLYIAFESEDSEALKISIRSKWIWKFNRLRQDYYAVLYSTRSAIAGRLQFVRSAISA